MRNRKLIAILLAVAASLVQAAAYAAPKKPFKVEVVNEADDPLPVVVTNPTAIDVNVPQPLDVNVQEPLDVNVQQPLQVTPTPSATTHMGVNASEHVLLFTGTGPFKRVLPDATLESADFVVPSGKAFVLTDAEFRWTGADPVDTTMLADILLSNPGSGNSQTVLRISERFNADGDTGAVVSLTSGIVFGPGTKPEVTFNTQFIGFFDVSLMGYLVPNL